jgi:hypothetical protein
MCASIHIAYGPCANANFSETSTEIKSRSKADKDAYEAQAHRSGSQSNYTVPGTPTKGSRSRTGNSSKLTRTKVESTLASELHERRFKSCDLIDDQFGHLVSLEHARLILPHLVKFKFLDVKVKPASWSEDNVYDYAFSQAESFASDNTFNADDDKVVWAWSPSLSTSTHGPGTQRGSAQFLNAIALAAYIVGVRLRADPPNREDLKTRLVHNPYSKHALPLAASDEKQDCRPDLLGLNAGFFCNSSVPTELSGEVVDVGALVGQDLFSGLLDPKTRYCLRDDSA